MPSPPSALIRPARRGDAEAILRIDQRTWSTLVTPGPAPEADDDPLQRRAPSDVLVAEQDGTVVGYVNLGRPTPLAAGAHVWEIQGLAVDPSSARQGIGRRLVDAAVEEARVRGARKVSLRVLGHNRRARELYEAAGFGIEGVLRAEFLLDGEPVDDVIMARHLGTTDGQTPTDDRRSHPSP